VADSVAELLAQERRQKAARAAAGRPTLPIWPRQFPPRMADAAINEFRIL
jgi:hypothetical protein